MENTNTNTSWLESLDRPALAVAPVPEAGQQASRPPGLPEALARIEALERRVLTLDAAMHKTSALANAVRSVIARWPGPFTAQQIRAAVMELYPGLMQIEQRQSVESKIHRMVKQGQAVCLVRGAGPPPSIYERVATPPPVAGRKGAKSGARHSYETGFRAIVREFLMEREGEFTLVDLQRWVAERHPDLRVPEGSWSSTLHQLTELGELRVTRRPNRGKTLKTYERTSKRVAPSGAELREVEAAWREFRRSVKADVPEILPSLQRDHD